MSHKNCLKCVAFTLDFFKRKYCLSQGIIKYRFTSLMIIAGLTLSKTLKEGLQRYVMIPKGSSVFESVRSAIIYCQFCKEQ